MTSSIPRLAIAVACVLAAVGLAACGSSDDSTSTTPASTPASSSTDTSPPAAASPYGSPADSGTSSSSGGGAEISVDNNGDLGQILVDAKGNTVYLFEADKGSKSTCNGDCAQAWPPVTSDGVSTAGTGADASLLGTTKRDDGTTEVTYAGHPLYYYAGDSKPGDTTGNNVDQFGTEWYALTPKGETPEDKGSGNS